MMPVEVLAKVEFWSYYKRNFGANLMGRRHDIGQRNERPNLHVSLTPPTPLWSAVLPLLVPPSFVTVSSFFNYPVSQNFGNQWFGDSFRHLPIFPVYRRGNSHS
jgi:hypothetical protein